MLQNGKFVVDNLDKIDDTIIEVFGRRFSPSSTQGQRLLKVSKGLEVVGTLTLLLSIGLAAWSAFDNERQWAHSFTNEALAIGAGSLGAFVGGQLASKVVESAAYGSLLSQLGIQSATVVSGLGMGVVAGVAIAVGVAFSALAELLFNSLFRTTNIPIELRTIAVARVDDNVQSNITKTLSIIQTVE